MALDTLALMPLISSNTCATALGTFLDPITLAI